MSEIFKLEAAYNRLLSKCQYLETEVDGHRQFNTALQKRIATLEEELELAKDTRAIVDKALHDRRVQVESQRERITALEKVIADCNGCIQAAQIEGLAEALAETSDERLKDLVERRLLWVEHYCAGYLKGEGE